MTLKKKWWASHIANRKTKEIHCIGDLTDNCCIEAMNQGNVIYCFPLWPLILRLRGYNGCRYCWPEQDRG